MPTSPHRYALLTFLSVACVDPFPLQAVTQSGGSGTVDAGTVDTTATQGSASVTSVATSADESSGPDGPAVDDCYAFLREDSPLHVTPPGVLGNDLGESLEVLDEALTTERGGMVSLSVDGAFSYTPPPDPFWGTDGFEYTVQTAEGSSSAHVEITVRPSQLLLSDISAGFGGFVIDGFEEQQLSGIAISGGGDINGDGLADLVVGATGAAADTPGAAYVVFGKESTSPVNLEDVSTLGQGLVIAGSVPSNVSFGRAIATGDLDNDGLHDIVVGDPDASTTSGASSGQVVVVFGDANLEDLTVDGLGPDGFSILGEGANDSFGWAVAITSDINGDELPELAVGARDAANEDGRGYVIFGQQDPAEIDLSMDSSSFYSIDGIPTSGEFLGQAVAGLDDINGDGRGDCALGAFRAPFDETGRSIILFGGSPWSEADIPGTSPGDLAGYSLAGAGLDFNGDGWPDLVVGAAEADGAGTGAGRVYIVFGPITDDVNLSTLSDDQAGSSIAGQGALHRAGSAIASLGDVNGDGYSDLLVGAYSAPSPSTGANEAGRAYLVYGRSDPATIPLDSVAAGTGGFVLIGENAVDWAGYSVTDAGDVNGDGVPDFAVGAYRSDPSGNESGRVYVIFGFRDTKAIEN